MAGKFLEQLGYLFYVVSPGKTSYSTAEEVPDYVLQVFPHFFLLVVLEHGLLLYQRRPLPRVNDSLCSISQGLLQQLTKVFDRGIQLVAYAYVYDHWRLATLPWDSAWTWWLCFLAVDFAYYWLHRASHEINILWAAHQVHHSSEDYNLSTALRQSAFQNYSVMAFNLPMALAVPPSVFLVHNQFNLLYQFWIHTEVIKSLGPLEWVLNTASHHRVHHGRNRYCIDKNYAGVLIVWDRMFGTFQAEDEQVVYGLTHPLNSFESLYVQLCHYLHVWRTFWATPGLGNRLSVLFKGPGWSPGTKWHGDPEDIPEVKAPAEKFDPPSSPRRNAYALVHFALLVALYVEIVATQKTTPWYILFGCGVYEVVSISALGMLMEDRYYAPWAEMLRCTLFVFVDYFYLPHSRIYASPEAYKAPLLWSLRLGFICSTLVWAFTCGRSVTVRLNPSERRKGD